VKVEGQKKRLVYYDSKGKRRERLVSVGLYQRLLEIFDGNLKAVPRSSGGLGLAIPRGLKFRSDDKNHDEENVLVWMNCKDFEASSTARESVLNRPKLVRPEDIREAFSFTTGLEQRYRVDLGKGPVPIHVFRYTHHSEKQIMAAFIDAASARAAFSGNPGLRISVQLHWIPQECLRWASTSGEEFERHFKDRKISLPRILRVGEPLLIEAGKATHSMLQEHLVKSTHREHTNTKETGVLTLGDEGLLPFGLFEPTYGGGDR
jgi:hypothetical protein